MPAKPKTTKPNTKKPATKKTAKPAPAQAEPSSGRWLLKSEPDAFSWDQLVALGAKGEPWTGVRNYQARNFMKAMQAGDLCFFYHSNEGKEIVGVVRVITATYPEPGDETGKWECVEVEAVCDLSKPVTLVDVKGNPKLDNMSLVTCMRLSVQPVTADEWKEICAMGGLDPKKLEA